MNILKQPSIGTDDHAGGNTMYVQFLQDHQKAVLQVMGEIFPGIEFKVLKLDRGEMQIDVQAPPLKVEDVRNFAEKFWGLWRPS